jgi:hypothetical protein
MIEPSWQCLLAIEAFIGPIISTLLIAIPDDLGKIIIGGNIYVSDNL